MCLVSDNRARLVQVERLALRKSLDDVHQHDVRVVTLRNPLCTSCTYIACTDYGYLSPAHLHPFTGRTRMADFLTQTRADLDKRLKELRPLYEEYLKLEKAKAALDGVDAPRRGPGRPRGSGTTTRRAAAGNGRRRRRRRRGGTRAEQALAVVRDNPGISVTELAPKVGIPQKNYLYRVMNQLADDGLVRKQGRGYHAV